MKPKASCLTIAMLTLFVAAPPPASAQDRKPNAEKLAKRFASADKNGDGRLTLEEAKAGMPRVAKNFDTIEKDKKGYVTLDEIKAAMAESGSR